MKMSNKIFVLACVIPVVFSFASNTALRIKFRKGMIKSGEEVRAELLEQVRLPPIDEIHVNDLYMVRIIYDGANQMNIRKIKQQSKLQSPISYEIKGNSLHLSRATEHRKYVHVSVHVNNCKIFANSSILKIVPAQYGDSITIKGNENKISFENRIQDIDLLSKSDNSSSTQRSITVGHLHMNVEQSKILFLPEIRVKHFTGRLAESELSIDHAIISNFGIQADNRTKMSISGGQLNSLLSNNKLDLGSEEVLE